MSQVILVDSRNQPIGTQEKLLAHKLGQLHRAFSILVFNSENQILLQQRAAGKYHCPLLWSNTACSHPAPGEDYQQAIHRRLQEEMGFDCPLKQLFCFTYQAEFSNNLIENEYDCVFVGRFAGQIKFNPKEVQAYKWLSLSELKSDIIKNPERYTVWFKLIIDKLDPLDIKKLL